MGEKYYVTTEPNGWSTVHGGDDLELWRYDWEAQERADELNRREATQTHVGEKGHRG